MPHLHSIYDTDLHFIIDPIKRSITSESGKVSLMQYDHNSERFTFEVPRFIEGHDMSQSEVMEIHYINVDAANKQTMNKDIYVVDDLQVSPDSPDVVIGSWLISKNATTYAGSLSFIVRFVCYSEQEIEYQWFSDVHAGIKIVKGIYNSEVLPADYDVDTLECWKRDVIAAFEASAVYKDSVNAREVAVAKAAEAVDSAAAAKESELNADRLLTEVVENLKAGVYDGQDGIQGPQGEKGEKGDTGAVGPMGPTGATGPQGPQGLKGPAGATGATGATGPRGEQGIRGAQGERGPEGATGATGPQGIQGLRGVAGPQGLIGPQGPTGPAGPAGIQGPKGDPGESGVVAPINGFFTLSVDANGDLYAVSNAEDTPIDFEYDEDTGDLYILQEV